MNKQTIPSISNVLSGFTTLPEPKAKENIKDYAERAYLSFDKFLDEKSKEIDEVQDFVNTIQKKALYNAIAKVPIRRAIVAKWCSKNDKFEIEEPSEATESEILEFNGLPATLGDQMEADQFQNLIKKLKTPKSDGLTKTEVAKMREDHYGKHEPIMPSQKSYVHGNGGETRRYHWGAEIQDLYLEDHLNFIASTGIEDKFHNEKSTEQE